MQHIVCSMLFFYMMVCGVHKYAEIILDVQ